MSERNEGTKEDVSQLCSCPVAKVVRTTRRFLIPALRKVLCIPVTYVIPCGTRASMSDAKKDGELSLEQENLRFTDEMLLALNEQADEILQERVAIVNGVPVLIEGPLRAEHAKAFGISLSIPLLDQLTGTEFRKRATEQVSEVLLTTLDNDSCHESNTKSESQTNFCELPAFYPPGSHSQSVADDLVDDIVDDFVCDVIDSMNEDMSQNVRSAAYDVVGYVVAGMKDLVETARVMGGVSMTRICSTSETMFSAIQNAVRKLFSKSVSSDSEEETTMASARHVISQVILSMMWDLSALKSAEDLEQIALVQEILSALLIDVRERSQQNLETTTSPCVLNMFEGNAEGNEGSAASANSDDFKNDYASLVSMLVIRLLRKVSLRTSTTHQDGVPDKVLDISRQLIQKILCELDTRFGITGDESHPQQVNFHLMYRNVYKDLTREFGSEDVLCSALESQDPSFESSLVEKLTGEIVKTCSQTNVAASEPRIPPIKAVTGLQQNNKTKKKITPSWLKMPKFNWKKSKNGAQSLLDCEGSLVPSTSSSQVQAMKSS
ncbi:uncharacterized protein LOC134069719 [Sardina pilchardus]|uniref:uncharacterized protein LOC134069719 n=1 Tax=Sardina pilchardus TaxID=27697 RepID=UPI002E11536C